MECPNCGHNLVYVLTDEKGHWYECLNCDYEYCDDSQKADVSGEQNHPDLKK